MEKLHINGTIDSPEVLLDAKQNEFKFSGKSKLIDVYDFYNPVLKWLDIYKAHPNNQTVVDFKMEYFNVASSKIILDILMKFEEINNNDKALKINWHFSSNDLDMKDAGEEYADIVEVPFSFVPM
jgi:hypothetical protein